MMDATFVLAAAQATPAFHDKAGTLDVTCEWIERAGRAGADMVVFPETFFPGFPYWRHGVSRADWVDRMVELQANSLHVEDDAVDILGDVIDDQNVHVVLGTNERDDRPGSETLYNSLFFFDRDGELVRRHRKLVPTTTERAVWGRGDPTDLSTHDTDVGTVGGLICYENHMTLSKAVLTAMGQEIHPAVWPGFWEQPTPNPGSKTGTTDPRAIETCDVYPAIRELAFETQSFVVSCSAYVPDDVLAEFYDVDPSGNHATGGSMLVGPTGLVREGPVLGEETLLTAEFDRSERTAAKSFFDAMGHYTRWDAVSLLVSDHTDEPITTVDESGSVVRRPARADSEFPVIDEEAVRRITAETDAPKSTVRSILETAAALENE